jgi:serine/threonine protein kinase
MSEILKCHRCGSELPPDSPEGLCPRCLLALNLATQTEIPGETGPTRPPLAPPLPVAEAAKLFPQMEIIEFLGRGGMGAVYKARQPRLDRFVALKILSPEKQGNQKFAERFEREARALAKLHHPNIVAVYDFGEAQGNFYLLMEYVDGATLRQLIAVQKLSSNQALVIVPKICDALQYAHGQGIVHRDIKPENILIDKGGAVKIADFGIAKILGDNGSSNLTAEQVIGTPHYMSPEQIEKPQTVDHRADIYSLGVVFYEMLTGELPLGKFPPPSRKVQVDVRLDEVVLRALEKEPERRYQQASEVKSQVETIAGTPQSSGRAPVSWDRRENYFWRWAAGIVLSLIASLVLYACIMSVVVKRVQMNAQPHITLITSSNTVIQVPMPAGAALMIGDKKINPVTGLPMAAGQVQLINPATGLPMTPGESGAINPATGLPANASGKDQAINPATGLPMTPSQTQTINPATGLLESAQKPDAQAELQKAQDLMNGGDYEGSLQTFISYFNDSKFEAGQAGVRLSFALSDWVELGRRYPKAKEALIKIRDNDTQKFAQGQGYFDLFSEVSAINQYLGNEDATYQLFKSIETTDPQLAGQCFFDVESLLVKKGDYETCRKYMGDPERAFEILTNMYRMDLQNQARMKALNADTAKRMAAMRKKNGWTNLPAFSLPDTSAMMLRSSHDRFTGGVRQLIEILVATGDKSEAENIQQEALGVLDDLQLHSAVEDAEAKLQESGENTNTLSDDLRHAHEELAKLRINYGEQNPEVKEVLARIQELERISKEEPDLPPNLREARVHLAELRAFEGPENPDVQGVSARIKELERISKEEPGASPELREAKANLAELLCHYGEDNPVIQQAKAKIQELESESASFGNPIAVPQDDSTVLAEQPPVVVETFPPAGARDVLPGEVEIRVRFSKDMAGNSWTWSTAWENSTPETIGPPHYLDDHRTCVLKVKLEPGRTYAWWLNSDKFKNFEDAAGQSSVPYLFSFQTKPN